jgi:predicted RNA methylase
VFIARREVERLGRSLIEHDGRDAEAAFHDACILLLRSLALGLADNAPGAQRHIDLLLPSPPPGPLPPEPMRTAGTPHTVLSRTYEELLRFQPVLECGRFALVPVRDRKRARGAFYTPAPIARRLVRATLSATPLTQPVILDPAMGTGAFLFEAVRALAAAGHASGHVAATSIYGIDRDWTAVRVAALSLWLETGADPTTLLSHLVCADSLSDTLPAADIVLGNPPWGISIQGVDSFKCFTVRAAGIAREGLGLVLPHAVLRQTTHIDVRRALLDRLTPFAVLDLGNGWFEDAAAPACGLVFGPGPGVERIAVATMRRGSPVHHRTISRSLWNEGGFPVSDYDALALLARLRRTAPALGDLTGLFQVHDSGINYVRSSIARAALYQAETPADPRDVARFRGRSFHRYTSIRRDGWVRYQWHAGDGPNGKLFYDRDLRLVPDKLVLRQTADRIIATLDRTGMVMGRSVIAITARSPQMLLPLLACLNSRLLALLYRAMAGEEGRVLPQVKVARLRALPIPRGCMTADDGWLALASLAVDMLSDEGRNASLDRAIDAEVCALYGLSAGEANVISSL